MITSVKGERVCFTRQVLILLLLIHIVQLIAQPIAKFPKSISNNTSESSSLSLKRNESITVNLANKETLLKNINLINGKAKVNLKIHLSNTSISELNRTKTAKFQATRVDGKPIFPQAGGSVVLKVLLEGDDLESLSNQNSVGPVNLTIKLDEKAFSELKSSSSISSTVTVRGETDLDDDGDMFEGPGPLQKPDLPDHAVSISSNSTTTDLDVAARSSITSEQLPEPVSRSPLSATFACQLGCPLILGNFI